MLAQEDLWLTNDAKPMMPEGYGFQLFTDRAPLRVGQTVRALLVTQHAGGHALVTIENEHLQWAKALELNGRARFIEVPLSADMAPNSWLSVFRFEECQPYNTTAEIHVKGSEVELPVKVSWPKPSVEPGTSVPVTVEAPGAPKGADTEVAVTIVDEALYAIEPGRTDFLQFFGRRRRELRVQTSSTMNNKAYRRPVPKEPPLRTSPSSRATRTRWRATRTLRRSRRQRTSPSAAAGAPASRAAPSPVAVEKEEAAKKPAEHASGAAKRKAVRGPAAGPTRKTRAGAAALR